MVTKATRDVIDLGRRGGIDITQDPSATFIVRGDCSSDFSLDGVPVGTDILRCDGFFGNLTATNLVIQGTFEAELGAMLVGTWAATYSDIAERYESDKDYTPGTVVKIGGDKEITATDVSVDDVFGVISTNPAYVLNSGQEGLYLPVVMVGRIPVRVTGPIVKGDRLVSSNIPGVARAVKDSERSCHTPIFGRALENSATEGERLVEVAFITIR